MFGLARWQAYFYTSGNALSETELLEQSPLALFDGKHLLIVEDEYFLADETRRELEGNGVTVVGPTGTVEAALGLLETEKIDAAILDIQLVDELVFVVAEELERRRIPFVLATSRDPSLLHPRFTGFAFCEKPTELCFIAEALFGNGPPDVH